MSDAQYRAEAGALDDEILRVIERWHRSGDELDERDFNDLALRIFAHQLRYNEPYARYAASFGYAPDALPSEWESIPAVPGEAFKEATLTTFDSSDAALSFHTSGTTQGIGGRHFFETRALYDAALLAGFDRFMLSDGARLRYLNLVPNPARRSESSLGYMMARIAASRGDGETGWYLDGETLLINAFLCDVADAIAREQCVCIAATAFALVHILDAMRERDLSFALPLGSRIMETGGFKGRTRSVAREALYGELSERFALPQAAIVAEYGMTELTSQFYDAPPSRAQSRRVKVAPPWLRARVIGPDGANVATGDIGALVHVDLANRASCIAVATEDLGVAATLEGAGAGGFVLLGRDENAPLRGCSLGAEHVAVR